MTTAAPIFWRENRRVSYTRSPLSLETVGRRAIKRPSIWETEADPQCCHTRMRDRKGHCITNLRLMGRLQRVDSVRRRDRIEQVIRLDDSGR